jgi:hypothetical protein
LANDLVEWLQQIAGKSTTVEQEYQVWNQIVEHNRPIIDHHLDKLELLPPSEDNSLRNEILMIPQNRQFLQEYGKVFDAGIRHATTANQPPRNIPSSPPDLQVVRRRKPLVRKAANRVLGQATARSQPYHR